MAFAEWKDEYSVGVDEIDVEHKGLLDLISTLHGAMREGKGAGVLEMVIADLLRYTQRHFTREEALMHKCNYPALEQHRELHRQLTAKVQQFADDLRKGKIALSTPLSGFLRTWLVEHILGADRLYAPYVR